MIALMLGVMPAVPAFAQSYPTVKVNGGDLLAGGWFGSTCNQAGNPYQDAAYTNGGTITDNSSGGIFTYNGSSSAFAAYALGSIDKTAGVAPNGFTSSSVLPFGNSRLSFANINYLSTPGYIGGNWDGGVQNVAHCIPDYFTTKTPTGLAANGIPLPGTLGSGAQYFTGTDGGSSTAVNLSGSDVLVKAGADVVVFIDGNLHINHNIRYDTGNYNVTNIPKFALIVKGNIYVDPAVTQLDGLYITQPDSSTFGNNSTVSAKKGDFWTCHSSDSTQVIDSTYLNGCQSVLTVNGAVITKNAYLLRTNGSSGVGEVFNYTPEMVIGGAFFPDSNPVSGGANNQPVFDRIISLPPVF